MIGHVQLVYPLVRRLLFLLDPESSHEAALAVGERLATRSWAVAALRWLFAPRTPGLATRALGLEFRSPIGLAAGFDKDARLVPLLGALGFGHLEIGSVLPAPYLGNPRPRLFRLPADRAIVNRMGLPSRGAARVAEALAHSYAGCPVGVNLARIGSGNGGAARIVDELAGSAVLLGPVATWLTINASCPNTEDGRTLEDPALIKAVLAEVLARLGTPRPPVLVKLSPDLAEPDALRLAAAAIEAGAAGLVCGNTTRSRDGLSTAPAAIDAIGAGGLSGPPLYARVLDRIGRLRRTLGPGPTLVACGGVTHGREVFALIKRGADLVQVYTALVYRGPAAPGLMAAELAAELDRTGARSLDAIRGSDA